MRTLNCSLFKSCYCFIYLRHSKVFLITENSQHFQCLSYDLYHLISRSWIVEEYLMSRETSWLCKDWRISARALSCWEELSCTNNTLHLKTSPTLFQIFCIITILCSICNKQGKTHIILWGQEINLLNVTFDL